MKKGLLRTLSAVVAISMLLCMGLSAAAVTTSTSVTEYDIANSKVTVTTNVAGAVPSEQVAFLVEKGANIIWIDQKPADNSGAASSSFTDTVANAIGATAKVGTASTAATAITQAGAIALPSYNVTWSVKDSTTSYVVAVVGDAAIDKNATSVSTTDAVTFYVVCAPDEELLTINGDEAALVDGKISYNVGETKVTAYEFAFGKKDIDEVAAPVATKSGDVTKADAENKAATVIATAENATEYGIVVAKQGYDFTQVEANFASLATDGGEGVEVIKLAALGANAEGQFVIKIDDAAQTFFVDGTIYEAKVYALKGETLSLSDTFELN